MTSLVDRASAADGAIAGPQPSRHGLDPLRLYLQQVARIEPLDRESELTLARQIARAKRRRACEVLSSPRGLAWIAELPDMLARGVIRAGDLVGDGPGEARSELDLAALRSQITQSASIVRELGGPDAAATLRPLRLLATLGRLPLAERHVTRVERELIDAAAHDQQTAEALAPRFNRIAAAACRLEAARRRLVESHQRLVLWLARRFSHPHLQLLDLVQEGNLGLMRAVEKFDHRRGLRLATYATWWIRQAMTRAIAEQGRTIRLPVWLHELYGAAGQTARTLAQRLGREPDVGEVASGLAMRPDDLRVAFDVANEPRSLDEPLGRDDDRTVGDAVAAPPTDGPVAAVSRRAMRTSLERALGTLAPREIQVLSMRYGIGARSDHTLEEIGGRLGLTRERIRQIESAALRKLRHPARAHALREFLPDPD